MFLEKGKKLDFSRPFSLSIEFLFTFIFYHENYSLSTYLNALVPIFYSKKRRNMTFYYALNYKKSNSHKIDDNSFPWDDLAVSLFIL